MIRLSDLEPGEVFIFVDEAKPLLCMLIIEWFKPNGRHGLVELDNGHVATFEADSPFWGRPVEKRPGLVMPGREARS